MTDGPSPVLTRSSFLAKSSARINAASDPSPQYPECAYTRPFQLPFIQVSRICSYSYHV